MYQITVLHNPESSSTVFLNTHSLLSPQLQSAADVAQLRTALARSEGGADELRKQLTLAKQQLDTLVSGRYVYVRVYVFVYVCVLAKQQLVWVAGVCAGLPFALDVYRN